MGGGRTLPAGLLEEVGLQAKHNRCRMLPAHSLSCRRLAQDELGLGRMDWVVLDRHLPRERHPHIRRARARSALGKIMVRPSPTPSCRGQVTGHSSCANCQLVDSQPPRREYLFDLGALWHPAACRHPRGGRPPALALSPLSRGRAASVMGEGDVTAGNGHGTGFIIRSEASGTCFAL